MSGYTKLFSDILTSSIWNEDDKTRIVWITLLALSDMDGIVKCARTSLAIMARVQPEACDKCITRLENPDPESKNPANQGRRIEPIDGGWKILNYEDYRNRLSTDREALMSRERQRKHRVTLRHAERRDPVVVVDVASVVASSGIEGGSGETSTGQFTLQECLDAGDKINMKREDIEACFHHYNAAGWMLPGNRPVRNLSSCLSKWKANQANFKPALPERKPSPQSIAEKICNEILLELWSRPKSEHADYISTCPDKYRTAPKLEGFTVWSAALRLFDKGKKKVQYLDQMHYTRRRLTDTAFGDGD